MGGARQWPTYLSLAYVSAAGGSKRSVDIPVGSYAPGFRIVISNTFMIVITTVSYVCLHGGCM